MAERTGAQVHSVAHFVRFAMGVFVVGASLAWSLWPTWCEMLRRWRNDPQFSHGFFVPVFAVFLLWHRRGLLKGATPQPSGWGLALVGLGAALRVAGAYQYYLWLDPISLLPTVAGICLLGGGWPYLRWAWRPIAFLFFMIPLPYRVAVSLAVPLQQFATRATAFSLQVLGVPALVEGNLVQLGRVELEIVESCNGLSMTFTFFAIAVALSFLLQRPFVDKILIVLSAVPIALAANVARITLTALLHVTLGDRAAAVFYHDLAAWLMMPFALLLLWAETRFLARLFVDPEGACGLRPNPGWNPVELYQCTPQAAKTRVGQALY